MKIAKKVNKDLVNKLMSVWGDRELLDVMKNKCGSRLIKFFLEFLNLYQKMVIIPLLSTLSDNRISIVTSLVF